MQSMKHPNVVYATIDDNIFGFPSMFWNEDIEGPKFLLFLRGPQ